MPAADSSKLRILLITPCFYPAWAYGGIPRVVYELSMALTQTGHEVTVYTTDVLDLKTRYIHKDKRVDVNGVETYYFRNMSNALAYRHQIYLPHGMTSIIKNEINKFDIIHLHGHRNILNNIIHYYANRLGIPYVLSAHGTVLRIERKRSIKYLFDIIFGDRVLRDAKCFVAVSEFEVKQYMAMGIPKEKISVISNGININIFTKLPPKGIFRRKYGIGNRNIILYVGKFTPRKGLDFLIKSFSMLEDKNSILMIAGNDMGIKRDLEKLIFELGITKRIIFPGLLVDEEKLTAYVDADITVYPSTFEIFGLVPFESIMCGTPVIVTNDCGCGQIVAKEGIGYTVDYNNVVQLKEKIEFVLSNKKESNEKVEKGRIFIKRNLDWNNIADKTINLYRNIIV